MFRRFDIVNEFVKQIADILRAGAGFGVALEAEHGLVGQLDALQSVVEQGFVGNPCVSGQGVGIDGEAVVLAGDDDFAAVQVLHGVVCAVVAEVHFQGFCTDGEADELVSQADAEDGFAACHQFLYGFDGVGTRLGVAGAVGQEYAVRIERQHLFRAGLGGDDGQAAAALGEHTQDVGFYAEIVSDNVERLFGRGNETFAQRPFAFGPFVGFCAGNFFCQIFADHAAERGDEFLRFFNRGVRAGQNRAALCAFFTQQGGQAAGVDVGDGDGFVAHQIVMQAFGGAEVAVQERQVADNQACGINAAAFFIFNVGAGIADVGVGEGNDLFAVGRVGQDFLIAGHGSVEHDFAGSRTFVTD